MSKLYLVRGLPGSGKSTFAKGLAKEFGLRHLETDMYFVTKDGDYVFDGSKIKEAHGWCQDEVRKTLSEGKGVVVSNTFTQRWEMDPYLKMAKEGHHEVIIITSKGNFGSVHGVPEEALKRMEARWEDIEGETFINS